MVTSYLIIIKSRQLLSSSIIKVILFNNLDLAYEYAINLHYGSVKEKINTIDEVLLTNYVWNTQKNVFPMFECKLIPIDNDLISNIYQTVPENQKIIPYIYKELFVNNLINE